MGKLIRSSSLKVKVAYDTFYTLYINQFGHFQAIRKISTDRQTNLVIETPLLSFKMRYPKSFSKLSLRIRQYILRVNLFTYTENNNIFMTFNKRIWIGQPTSKSLVIKQKKSEKIWICENVSKRFFLPLQCPHSPETENTPKKVIPLIKFIIVTAQPPLNHNPLPQHNKKLDETR